MRDPIFFSSQLVNALGWQQAEIALGQRSKNKRKRDRRARGPALLT